MSQRSRRRAGETQPIRRIIGSTFLSLDGVMQGPGRPSEDTTGGFAHGGWMFGQFDDSVGAAVQAFFDRRYDLLLGRRTYDIFAAYWPYASGDEAPMGEAFTRAGECVLTRGQAALSWANSHALPDIDALVTLKATDGPDLLIQGSGTLYPALLRHGLLDRLTTLTFPSCWARASGYSVPARRRARCAWSITPSRRLAARIEELPTNLPVLPFEEDADAHYGLV